MDISRETADDRKHYCAYDIADFRIVWTCIVEWCVLNESIKKPARFQYNFACNDFFMLLLL